MKKLACKDLGGPCDMEVTGNSFEEIGKASFGHVMEQIQSGDTEHLAAVAKMKNATPEEQQEMMKGFMEKFEQAEEVN